VGFVIGFLYFLFVLSSLVLIAVILLQEGKGGGFAEAFSGIGSETFGVRASGLHKFTGVVAAVFVLSALLVSILRGSTSFAKPEPAAPIQVPAGEPPTPSGQPQVPADNAPPGEPK
jgi:protein translocase SecG subunit